MFVNNFFIVTVKVTFEHSLGFGSSLNGNDPWPHFLLSRYVKHVPRSQLSNNQQDKNFPTTVVAPCLSDRIKELPQIATVHTIHSG